MIKRNISDSESRHLVVLYNEAGYLLLINIHVQRDAHKHCFIYPLRKARV